MPQSISYFLCNATLSSRSSVVVALSDAGAPPILIPLRPVGVLGNQVTSLRTAHLQQKSESSIREISKITAAGVTMRIYV